MESFLGSISGFMNTIPDHRPRDLEAAIRPKCRVLHFPIRFPPSDSRFFQGEPDDAFGSTEPDIHSPRQGDPDRTGPVVNDEKIPCAASGPSLPPPPSPRRTSGAQPLHILWPHRWEHDKNPELFFETLFKLKEAGCSFRVSVLGETYTTVPSVFEEARRRLADEILHWGFQASREDYYGVLAAADVAISTAKHEFFGVAMIEAAHCGCYPLCPDALVYPEIFPAQCLFRTPAQLLKQLRYLCARPASLRQRSDKVDTTPFSWVTLRPRYLSLLTAPAALATDGRQVDSASPSE
ncbi:tRNA-queuosine alpha-mannosyltransferase-like isoform X14 [Lampetra planeri]